MRLRKNNDKDRKWNKLHSDGRKGRQRIVQYKGCHAAGYIDFLNN